MKKRLYADRILSGIAVLFWMVLIFGFSAQTGESSENMSGSVIKSVVGVLNPEFDTRTETQQSEIISSWQTVVRKTAHFSEYALLAILTANAIRTYKIKRPFKWIIPPAVCLIYAVSDELHQYFVGGRACRLFDVGVDTAGGIFGTAVFMLFMWLFARHRAKKKKEIYHDTQNPTAG